MNIMVGMVVVGYRPYLLRWVNLVSPLLVSQGGSQDPLRSPPSSLGWGNQLGGDQCVFLSILDGRAFQWEPVLVKICTDITMQSVSICGYKSH